MTEITEQAVVSRENYAELKSMLLSNDDASMNMALIILEQSDFEKSQTYILCLLKETFSKAFEGHTGKFRKECPELERKTAEMLKDTEVNISTLSFKQVYLAAVKKASREEVEFMLEIFQAELLDLLGDFGFGFTEYLDIQIKPKTKIEYAD